MTSTPLPEANATPKTADLRVRYATGHAHLKDVFTLAEIMERDNAALRGALECIVKHGGMTVDTEYGPINCSGFWCAEQARAALAGEEAKP